MQKFEHEAWWMPHFGSISNQTFDAKQLDVQTSQHKDARCTLETYARGVRWIGGLRGWPPPLTRLPAG
jgi:hypothetical protein